MTSTYEAAAPESDLRRRCIRIGDVLFRGLELLAALAAAVLLGLIAWKVFDLARPAFQYFGLSFVWTEAWNPVTSEFGALIFIYGTVVTSSTALVLATRHRLREGRNLDRRATWFTSRTARIPAASGGQRRRDTLGRLVDSR